MDPPVRPPPPSAPGEAATGVRLEMCGIIQEVQLLALPRGLGRVGGTGQKNQVDDPSCNAVDWLLAEAEAIGLPAHQAQGMDCRRLRKDFDVFGFLPPLVDREETHLASGAFLAAVSMVTGWQMDPSVRRGDCPHTGLEL